MPELPEVETVARGVDARVRGERIVGVWFGEKKEPLKSPAAAMERALTGARIAGVRRVGKTIVFDLAEGEEEAKGDSSAARRSGRKDDKKREADSSTARGSGRKDNKKREADSSTARRAGARGSGRKDDKIQNQWLVHRQWLVHLGMTGRLLVNAGEVERAKHTHAVVTLGSGQEIRFVDPRRFGRLSLVEGFEGTGVEPLTIGMEEFAGLFRGRKTPIKSALLNQNLLHGVGNIYADEALFRAGVRPRRQAARVTRAEMERLRVGLIEVLRQAIALGGSSVNDYVDAEGSRGFFQLEHRVYGRTGEPCRVCGTEIKRVVIAGRSSHFCSKCQR
jgi:formamidopyrimidine-DNA glycosylase